MARSAGSSSHNDDSKDNKDGSPKKDAITLGQLWDMLWAMPAAKAWSVVVAFLAALGSVFSAGYVVNNWKTSSEVSAAKNEAGKSEATILELRSQITQLNAKRQDAERAATREAELRRDDIVEVSAENDRLEKDLNALKAKEHVLRLVSLYYVAADKCDRYRSRLDRNVDMLARRLRVDESFFESFTGKIAFFQTTNMSITPTARSCLSESSCHLRLTS